MAKKADGWDLLKQGKYEQAIPLFYKAYEKEKPGIGAEADLGGVALAYLLNDQPKLAAEVLVEVLSLKHAGTYYFALAGVAQWISGEPDQGVSLWKAGRTAGYADAAGGMELPLLLYYASVRNPKLVTLTQANRQVKQQLKHPWASSWPGPLGAFVIDEISEKKIHELAVFKHEQVTRRQTLQVEFYVGVKAEQLGDHGKFASQMKLCASSAECESETEFYLARHEAGSALQASRK